MPDVNRRPVVHFTPPANWMNDPNGLVVVDGTYHLFYQHNPYDTNWGHMSWGHAVSTDLFDWRRLPVAIPEQPEAGYTIFSGSAVVDERDTAGFGRGAMVAVFTADHRNGGRLQDIRIASSVDGGNTFELYRGNPVLNVNEAKFGDPKVFRHDETNRWIMACIRGHETGCIELYASLDLKTWQYLSTYRAASIDGTWECPDLFEMPLDGDPMQRRWVMKWNTQGGASYVVAGRFDGTTFTPETEPDLLVQLDHGGLYAEMTYNNIPASDGRTVLIGWVPMKPDDRREWTGLMGVPRELELVATRRGPRLAQRPVRELAARRSGCVSLDAMQLREGELDVTELGVPGGAVDLALRFRLGTARRFGVALHRQGAPDCRVGYDVVDSAVFVEGASSKDYAAVVPVDESHVELHLLVDHHVVELFAQGGAATITSLLTENPTVDRLGLFAEGGTVEVQQADAWELV